MTKNIQQNYTNAQFPNTNNNSEDEIDLREFIFVIWRGKWLILALTSFFAIGSIVFAVLQPNIYKSEALLAPATEEKGSSLNALAGQFGGLASMAGINLGGAGSVDKTQMAIEVLKSRQFVSEFIIKHNILVDLMAVKSWNLQNDTIEYDPEIFDAEKGNWTRKATHPFKSKPSMQEAYKVFTNAMSVNITKDTGMVTVSVQHLSPKVAQDWVTWLVEDINIVMKERDVIEANRSREFLTKQIDQTKIADIRSILYKLVEEQEKTIMFAEVREEYIFKTIDPAFIPEERVKPNRALICILGTIFGGVFSILIVLFRSFIRK